MPLFLRRAADHFPDNSDRLPHLEHHTVLCGGLEVGGFCRIRSGPSEGRWSWGAVLSTTTADFLALGRATSPDECQTHIGQSFRAMLARAELRERPDAKPGPARRAPPESIDGPFEPLPLDEFEKKRYPMMLNERRVAVRSGELTVGALIRATHGDEVWLWFPTGIARPDDEDFVWRGHADTEDNAFDAFAHCWSQWLAWAGLEQVGELQRGVENGK
jgi:hypothetical protein